MKQPMCVGTAATVGAGIITIFFFFCSFDNNCMKTACNVDGKKGYADNGFTIYHFKTMVYILNNCCSCGFMEKIIPLYYCET